MRMLVLGAGKMGSAIAYDLVQAKGKQAVEIVDGDTTRARSVGQALGIAHSALDLRDEAAVAKVFKGANVIVSASDYSLNDSLTRQAIAAKACFCDLGGNNDVVARQLAQSDAAKASGVTVIPDCGLAPGLAGWLAARGVELVKDPVRAQLRVGGLPANPKPPLNYSLVFSVRGLTNEYLEPSEVLRDGKLVKVQTMTEIEELTFPAPFGRLEAFHTSGGVSTLTKTLAGKLRELDYKTIRYPGHAAIIKALIELGFLSEEPLTVEGVQVKSRPVTEAVFTRSLSLGDDDVVLLRVTVESKKERLIYQLIDRKDPTTSHTAMARTTGYPTSVVALMMADGRIQERGVVPGEKVVPVDALIEELKKRGVRIETQREHVA